MKSHTVYSTAAAARYQANPKIIPASPDSHRTTHLQPTPSRTHTHSCIQMEIKVHFYAQICSHTSAQTQVSAAAVICLKITAVILEERSYFHTKWERDVFRYCFNTLLICIRVRGWASRWEKASCKVLCGVIASPEPHSHRRRRRHRAIFTSVTIRLAGTETFSVLKTMKNCVCLASSSINRLIFLLLITQPQTADFK